jgi:hypothetical protein
MTGCVTFLRGLGSSLETLSAAPKYATEHDHITQMAREGSATIIRIVKGHDLRTR